MSQSRSKYEFWKEASLSQKLADKDEIFTKLSGVDPKISESIGVLLILIENKVIEESATIKLMLALLDVKRKARFATSERTNEITKMGLMMPKAEDIISEF